MIEDVDLSGFLKQWPWLTSAFPKPKPKAPPGPLLTPAQQAVMDKMPMLRKKEWLKVNTRVRKALLKMKLVRSSGDWIMKRG